MWFPSRLFQAASVLPGGVLRPRSQSGRQAGDGILQRVSEAAAGPLFEPARRLALNGLDLVSDLGRGQQPSAPRPPSFASARTEAPGPSSAPERSASQQSDSAEEPSTSEASSSSNGKAPRGAPGGRAGGRPGGPTPRGPFFQKGPRSKGRSAKRHKSGAPPGEGEGEGGQQKRVPGGAPRVRGPAAAAAQLPRKPGKSPPGTLGGALGMGKPGKLPKKGPERPKGKDELDILLYEVAEPLQDEEDPVVNELNSRLKASPDLDSLFGLLVRNRK